MPQAQNKLFLLDAMALIYRAYYAFSKNPRISSKGLNTSAILGFANTLTEVLKKENPSHIAVAFDSKAPTVRHTEFADYKATRQEVPEDIITSLPYIRRLIEGFNIPVIALDGYEADDIIGTLAKKAEKRGFQVFMMTPDKDFGQLVSENIFMYKPARMGNDVEIWGVKEVCEKFSIERPEQVIDLLGLWGDSSDNIPGVPGIGEKKAKNLIREFGTIENILENLDQIKEKRSQESLREFADQARLSKSLATIILDVPVEFDEKALRVEEPNAQLLVPLFEELEFRTFAKRILSDAAFIPGEKTKQTIAHTGQMDLFSGVLEDEESSTEEKLASLMRHKDYRTLAGNQDLDELLSKIKKEKHFCFDTETSSLETIVAEIVGVAFCLKPGQAWYLPFPEDQSKALELARKLKDVFEDETIEKTGQNLKFDISVLQNYDIRTSGRLFDTMLAHYLLQPDMRHNMDLLAQSYLNYTPVSIMALIGRKGNTQLNMRSVPVEKITAYACEDADVTLQLRYVFEPMLRQQNLLELFHKVETPLVPVLAEMERHGVSIDEKALEEYSRELNKQISQTEQEIYELAGVRFNIGSPKQLGEILFVRLKISEGTKKTKTRQYSTSEDVLSKLAEKHPVINKILDYRSLTKLKSTYVDALPKLINPKSGRIHTSYNQAVAATGRLSSNNPNLQNIPIRTEEGRLIRRAFVPENNNWLIMAADYSQIELRIIASMSKDVAMLEAFRHNLDIHTATAARVYEVELEQVTRDMRRNAKTVNFGIIYGISAFGLAERLNIPKHEAAHIINQYFEKYPGIKDYMENTVKFAREHQYVSTILGRRRYINDINSANAMLRGYAERNAINAPVQGSAADMIKLAMIAIHDEIQKKKLKSKMIMQVHDELVFEAHLDEVNQLKEIVENRMKNAMPLDVPVVVEMSAGSNWLEAH